MTTTCAPGSLTAVGEALARVLEQHQFDPAGAGVDAACYADGCTWSHRWDRPTHEMWTEHRRHVAAVQEEALRAASLLERAESSTDAEVIVMQVQLTDPDDVVEVDHDWGSQAVDDGDFVLVCPRAGCASTAFYEVDRAERWNPMGVERQLDTILHVVDGARHAVVTRRPNPLAGLPVLTVSEGSDGDGWATDRHICRTCLEPVDLPDWLQTEWVS